VLRDTSSAFGWDAQRKKPGLSREVANYVTREAVLSFPHNSLKSFPALQVHLI
jgi:hypothetical protein